MFDVRLISPDDGSPLREAQGCLIDESGNKYPIIDSTPDLRPRKPICGLADYKPTEHSRIRSYDFRRSLVPMFPNQTNRGRDVKEVNVVGFVPPPHPGAVCLDHGCGGGHFRSFLESFGYTYVGVDNESGTTAEQGGDERFAGGATHLCDLHRLPFRGQTFQFAVSYSVFEHLQNPFVAAAELFRVMEPGGVCFVAVASLIPFHMDSFYHHTHFGVLATFHNAGFEVRQVAGAAWNGYRAISAMDGLPGPKWIRHFFAESVHGAHRLLWRLRTWRQGKGRSAEELRRHLMMAGIVKAVLIKPSSQ